MAQVMGRVMAVVRTLLQERQDRSKADWELRVDVSRWDVQRAVGVQWGMR